MKKFLMTCLMIIMFICSMQIIKAEMVDWSSGSSGDASSIKSGGGEWKSSYVGLKVNIISKEKTLQNAKIFVNKNGTGSGTKFASKGSKLLAPSDYSVKWNTKANNYTQKLDILPDSWCKNNGCTETTNIYDWLTSNNYKNLKTIINDTITEDLVYYYDSYIVIEPMVRIGKYYGTAYELGKSFFDISEIGSKGTFAYDYSKNVFGGNINGGAQLLFNTIYVKSTISDLGVYTYSTWASKYSTYKYSHQKRNHCITIGRTCGRSMGVFSFEDIITYRKVTITKTFSNASIRNIQFKLEKYNSSTKKWETTGKSCKINHQSNTFSCEIKGLTNGTYRANEYYYEGGEYVKVPSNYYEIDCTKGCTAYSANSAFTFTIKDANKSVSVKNSQTHSVTINKSFSNTSIRNIQFKLEKYNSSTKKWETTGKSCKINHQKELFSCEIKGLTNGTYRANEYYYEGGKYVKVPSNYYEIDCTKGCTAYSANSAFTFTINNANKSVSVTNKKREEDKLKIIKVDAETKQPIENENEKDRAIFGLYSDKNCSVLKETVKIEKDGTRVIDNSSNFKSLKEIKPPTGYEKDDECHNIDSETTVTIENSKSCQTEFESLKQNNIVSMLDRLKLYDKYAKRNLLNMDKTQASEACSDYTPSYSKNTGCLSSSINNGLTFNSTNLSNFNDEFIKDYNGTTVVGYCLTSLNFFNKLDDNSGNYSTYAGMLLLKSSHATQSELVKKCYLFTKDNQGNYSNYTGGTISTNENYSDYVYNVKIGDKDLEVDDQELSYFEQGDGSYTSFIQKDYLLPEVFSKNGTGEISYGQCDTCKFLGNGIVSKLNSSASSQSLYFSYKSEFFGDQSGRCTYTITPKLIKDDQIQLEFRTIDTSNPFAGKSGTTRNVGTNWCEKDENGNIVSCSGYFNENNNIKNKIIESNNSYNRKNEGAKYVIELNSSNIQDIRNYNKQVKYDDYNFECINDGETCISIFLTNLKDEGVIKTLINDKREFFSLINN